MSNVISFPALPDKHEQHEKHEAVRLDIIVPAPLAEQIIAVMKTYYATVEPAQAAVIIRK